MIDLQLLPELLQVLTTNLECYLDQILSDRKKTLPVKIRQTHNNVIITWNVFPDSSNELGAIFKDVQNIINQKLDKLKKGEILQYEISNGHIVDSGSEAFLIKRGYSWDLYLYEPETFIYIRLLHESQINQWDEEWISIDIDIVNKSAWFKD